MMGSKKGVDPVKHAKAHVDCSSGINDTTLLAACLDALEVENVDESLEILYSSIFGAKRDKSVPMRKTAVKPTKTNYLCIGENSENLLAKNLLETLKREILNDANSEKIVLWEELPRWVVETTKRVFSEVFRALADLPQEELVGSENIIDTDRKIPANDEAVYSYMFNVIATIMCLDSMGVREVSCSPLPWIHSSASESSSSNAKALADLQRGMTIDPSRILPIDETISLASVLSIANGISLLRVLTGADTSCGGSTPITPMVLQRRGYGVDAKDANLKISIIVGSNNECIVSESGESSVGVVGRNGKCEENSLFHSDHVAHLETNLDDISGENLAFAMEMLLEHGAIDAWVTPIVMKKGRPAHTLHCLCQDNHSERQTQIGCSEDVNSGLENNNSTLDSLLELIFEHTSTLGVRIYRRIPRAKLDRSMVTVTTPFPNTSRKGRVDVKVSRFKNGRVVRRKAEFDHCKEIAIEAGVGIRVVADEAIKALETSHSNK